MKGRSLGEGSLGAGGLASGNLKGGPLRSPRPLAQPKPVLARPKLPRRPILASRAIAALRKAGNRRAAAVLERSWAYSMRLINDFSLTPKERVKFTRLRQKALAEYEAAMATGMQGPVVVGDLERAGPGESGQVARPVDGGATVLVKARRRTASPERGFHRP